jgi:hypothetical protein
MPAFARPSRTGRRQTACVRACCAQSVDAAAERVDTLIALRHPRVVALMIDGNEAAAGRTGPRFARAFRRAGAAGLKRTVHAGESSGPEGVRDAVELLGADHIDHGVRAIEDASVVALLADRRIPLGERPSSNLILGVYPSMAVGGAHVHRHQLRQRRHQGAAAQCTQPRASPHDQERPRRKYGRLDVNLPQPFRNGKFLGDNNGITYYSSGDIRFQPIYGANGAHYALMTAH